MRPKDLKNREIRNKNCANVYSNRNNLNNTSCVSGIKVNGFPPAQASNSGPRPGWQPQLQLKKYDNDPFFKPSRQDGSNNKQKKDSININLNQGGQRHPPMLNGSRSESAQIPFEYSPLMNPNQTDHSVIYVKTPNCGSDSGRSTGLVNLQENSLGKASGNVNPVHVHSSVKVSESPELTEYKNTWSGRTNTGVQMKSAPGDRQNPQFVHNDLELDSEQPQHSNTTILKLPSSIVCPRTQSSSDFSSHIVVPYEQRRSFSDSSLQLGDSLLSRGSLNGSVGSSPSNSLTTVTYTTVPTSTLSAPVHSNNVLNQDEYPSNLPSSLLFGDGTANPDNDYLFAQQLQRQFDIESEVRMRQNGFDILPDAFRPRRSQFSSDVKETEDFTTLDILNNFSALSLNDSSENNQEPVYDPNAEDCRPLPDNRPSTPQDESNICRVAVQDETSNQSGANVLRIPYIPAISHSREQLPAHSPEPIVIPMEEDTSICKLISS